MFRHQKRGRTYYHNLRLAALLSTVAGTVNIVGLLSLETLTTNVTGHFAFFSEGLFLGDYRMALISVLYVLFFLIGAFMANTAMEITTKYTANFSYIVPISMEIICLAAVISLNLLNADIRIVLGCILLLGMGLQNALVTKISGSVVRTTHLTGLFTDLGIELSQLLFYKKAKDHQRLQRNIFLRLIIIGGFFMGGIMGALFHRVCQLWTLVLPIALLVLALYYDRMRVNYLQLKRKWRRDRIMRLSLK